MLAIAWAWHRATHERHQVARIEVGSDWNIFLKSLSRAHRQATSKAVRRLNDEGEVRFQKLSHLDRQEVQPWLEKVFEIEDRSWKGLWRAARFCVRRGMCRFLSRASAQQVGLQWGQLEIVTLEDWKKNAIATMYGFSAKGVFYAHKIGYDPRFSHFSPGQVMFWNLLEQLHAEGQWQAIDCIGPLTEAIARWRPADLHHRPRSRCAAPCCRSGRDARL